MKLVQDNFKKISLGDTAIMKGEMFYINLKAVTKDVCKMIKKNCEKDRF